MHLGISLLRSPALSDALSTVVPVHAAGDEGAIPLFASIPRYGRRWQGGASNQRMLLLSRAGEEYRATGAV